MEARTFCQCRLERYAAHSSDILRLGENKPDRIRSSDIRHDLGQSQMPTIRIDVSGRFLDDLRRVRRWRMTASLRQGPGSRQSCVHTTQQRFP